MSGPASFRSKLGTMLGITLAAWSIAYPGRDDDRVLPLGGALFSLAYALWALRAAYRVFTARVPMGGIRHSRHLPVRILQVGTISLAGALVLLFILPFWLGSTFGLTILGDPGIEVTIRNETDEELIFYEVGRAAPFKVQLNAGEVREWGYLLHDRYTPEATDLAGNPIFCGRYTLQDLRRMRYVLHIVRDPASCPEVFPSTSRSSAL